MHLRLSLKNRIPSLCRWLIGATSRVINIRIDRLEGSQYSTWMFKLQRSAYISFFEWYYCILPFVIVRLFFLPNEPLSTTPIHTRMYNAISCEAALFKGCLANIEKIHQVAYGSTSWVSFWLFKYPWRWFFSPQTKYAPCMLHRRILPFKIIFVMEISILYWFIIPIFRLLDNGTYIKKPWA